MFREVFYSCQHFLIWILNSLGDTTWLTQRCALGQKCSVRVIINPSRAVLLSKSTLEREGASRAVRKCRKITRKPLVFAFYWEPLLAFVGVLLIDVNPCDGGFAVVTELERVDQHERCKHIGQEVIKDQEQTVY